VIRFSCPDGGLSAVAGGWSATRKLWQESRWVLVNALTVQMDFARKTTSRRKPGKWNGFVRIKVLLRCSDVRGVNMNDLPSIWLPLENESAPTNRTAIDQMEGDQHHIFR
jgi:hypothetical protein